MDSKIFKKVRLHSGRKRLIALTAVCFLTGTAALWAQTLGSQRSVGDPASEQKKATVSRFSLDVDNFTSVTGWKGVLMGEDEEAKTFLFGNYDASSTGQLKLGLGKKLGGLYLVAYYGGWLFKQSSTDTTTITKTYDVSGASAQEQQTRTVQTAYTGDPSTQSLNRLDLLLGFGSMGFRLGLYESLNVTEKPYYSYTGGTSLSIKDVTSFADGRTTVSETLEYKRTQGWFIPTLDWGAVFGSSETIVIKPQARFGFGVFFDDVSYNRREGNGFIDITEYGRAYGLMRPEGMIGADVGLKNGLTVSLFYTIDADLYGNKGPDGADDVFEDGGGVVYWSKAVVDRPASTTATDTITSSARTGLYNLIEPKVSWGKSWDAFKLGVRLQVPVTFNFTSQKNKTVETSTETTKDFGTTYKSQDSVSTRSQSEVEGSTVTIAPNVEVGGVYQVTEKFALSGGIKFTPISWSQSKTVTTDAVDKTVTTSYDQYGQVTNTNVSVGSSVVDKQTVNNSLTSMAFSLGLGVTFNLTDVITLDILAINASWTGGINFTALSGLVLSAKF
ncbi:MAG: hypothetical protein LBD20_06075 [Spirochaetaceae bacterium]|jgi:hypothetical protein|nr:hypothetical protein [Spirochaetaceae bacterium]